MLGIGDSTKILVTRSEANFDRACDNAYSQALMYFEIDEDGHSRRVRDWQRSRCWIEVHYVTYRRIGGDHVYIFTAKTCKSEDF